ncbi:signal peptidase I [Mangrovibacillus cuniculi]|uniref:Signal peptidase I n=1 Tax=Mangrovibacillus cuniculi TaxID=2593652 RepID=A0A7S8HFD5_9BACI|nr:signal peptidase I [Mangrovibacillus cuniculi]QPC46325.1 signal peptidase I [Mangrovibacillus cuniculi]
MKRAVKELFGWLKALVIAVVVAFVVRYYLFTPILVEGTSMVPTLANGDRMIVNKWNDDTSTLKRFDIIVFHSPDGRDFIKRVIGLPGDTITFRDDELYINGEKINEPYLDQYKRDLGEQQLTEDFTLFAQTGLESVPEDTVFVMGDNRGNSIDSRHFGPVDVEEIIGQTNIIYWPMEDIKIVK